jgi:Cu+-exporting ATPase
MKKRSLLAAVLVALTLAGAPIYAQKNTRPRTQNITVMLTRRGYEPSTIRLRKGVRTRLTFIRQTKDDCGERLLIPEYNINRQLPLNSGVTITLTPRKSGTFGFSCGMDMLHGTVIVS